MTRRTFDKQLELRNSADGNETSTAQEAGVLFEVRKHEIIEVVVDIKTIDFTTGDETYVFTVSTDSVAAFSDAPVVVGTLAYVASLGTGRIIIPIHGKTVEKVDPNAEAIRIGCTLAGTTPIINYEAFIAKSN